MAYLAPYTAHLAPYTAYIKPWSTYLTPYVPYLSPLLEPIHPNFPFAPIDVFGAMRLSSVVNWMASGAFDPPVVIEVNEKGKKAVERRRPPLLRELLGLMIVVFGPETFLGMLTGAPPSWLVSLKIPLLFCITHVIQTRTPLLSFLPKGPSLKLELPLAIPDAIGRSLLLTKFSILPLLRPTAVTPSLPANPASLLLVPFILTVPFASIVFSTLNFFAPDLHLTTPLELRPGGWMFADSFVPVVIPLVFLSLIGPVQGWGMGLGVGEDEAVLICAALTSLIFVGRAVYNFGHEAQVGGRRKIKTA